jgi:hypothetical protein
MMLARVLRCKPFVQLPRDHRVLDPSERAVGRGRGRPKGGGKRAAQALALIQGQPGITIPELARGAASRPAAKATPAVVSARPATRWARIRPISTRWFLTWHRPVRSSRRGVGGEVGPAPSDGRRRAAPLRTLRSWTMGCHSRLQRQPPSGCTPLRQDRLAYREEDGDPRPAEKARSRCSLRQPVGHPQRIQGRPANAVDSPPGAIGGAEREPSGRHQTLLSPAGGRGSPAQRRSKEAVPAGA